MDICVIWGNGADDYEKIINQVKYEELKGNIKIAAVVARRSEIFGNRRDGYLLISKEELTALTFDILIIASSKYYKEIRKEAMELGIPENHMINGNAFRLPLFDYSRYIRLVKEPVTILSYDCWGGYIYNKLYLQFTSPLINIYWQKDSYMKFIQDPLFYFEQPLEMHTESNLREGVYPVGVIGGRGNQIRLEFVHARNFEEAKTLWDRRKERVNPERIFLMLGIDGTEPDKEKYLKIFEKLPFPKICFYAGETSVKDVIYLKRFEWHCYQGSRMDSIRFTDYARNMTWLPKDIDLLKLLNGEKDYLREYDDGVLQDNLICEV